MKQETCFYVLDQIMQMKERKKDSQLNWCPLPYELMGWDKSRVYDLPKICKSCGTKQSISVYLPQEILHL